MTRFEPEKRPAARPAVCRSCDKTIKKGAEMLSWYSSRNRGQHIHLCLSCSVQIGEMAKDKTP